MSEADRLAVRRIAANVGHQCTMEANSQTVRSTATFTVGSDGHQAGGIRFSPPVPEAMIQCFAMFSLNAEFEPGRIRTVRVPFRVEPPL